MTEGRTGTSQPSSLLPADQARRCWCHEPNTTGLCAYPEGECPRELRDGGTETSQPERPSSLLRVRLLVGKHPDDRSPSVAGCVDESIWEVEGEEHTDARWKVCKKPYLGAAEYAWREVVIEIPEADVMRYFDAPKIQARVDTSEPQVEA